MVTGAETGRLMPFVLEPERTGAPPAELFDLGSEIWRSHETYPMVQAQRARRAARTELGGTFPTRPGRLGDR
jgi:hypothetical protein